MYLNTFLNMKHAEREAASPIPAHLTLSRRTRLVALTVATWNAYGEAVENLHTAATAITPDANVVMVHSLIAQALASRFGLLVDTLATEAGMEPHQVRNDLSRYGAAAPRFFGNVRTEGE